MFKLFLVIPHLLRLQSTCSLKYAGRDDWHGEDRWTSKDKIKIVLEDVTRFNDVTGCEWDPECYLKSFSIPGCFLNCDEARHARVKARAQLQKTMKDKIEAMRVARLSFQVQRYKQLFEYYLQNTDEALRTCSSTSTATKEIIKAAFEHRSAAQLHHLQSLKGGGGSNDAGQKGIKRKLDCEFEENVNTYRTNLKQNSKMCLRFV